MRGVIYVAYGDAAVTEARCSITVLRERSRWREGVAVVAAEDPHINGAVFIEAPDVDPGARWAKLNLDTLAPWPEFLYLDADTRPGAELEWGFGVLAAGWDFVICPSRNQEDSGEWLWHTGAGERDVTAALYGCRTLQLQGGVFWARKSDRLRAFFAAWRKEWERWRGPDQGALLRALKAVPLHVWMAGWCWNGGVEIAHRFGAARRGR